MARKAAVGLAPVAGNSVSVVTFFSDADRPIPADGCHVRSNIWDCVLDVCGGIVLRRAVDFNSLVRTTARFGILRGILARPVFGFEMVRRIGFGWGGVRGDDDFEVDAAHAAAGQEEQADRRPPADPLHIWIPTHLWSRSGATSAESRRF